MRLLHIDIESRPAEAYVWSLWPNFISTDQVKTPVSMMCFAAKWHGTPPGAVVFSSEFHHGRQAMLESVADLLDKADAVCTWNGDKYDVPHLNRELLQAGVTPPSPFKSIDLMKVVKRRFRFMSNKLQHVSTELGLEGKVQHNGFDLWVRCMAGDPKAWAQMRKYNKQDVTLLEQLYDRLLPWIPNHPNVALFSGDPAEISCTRCGSTEYQKRGVQIATTGRYQRYQCTACGGWFRDVKREAGTGVTGA